MEEEGVHVEVDPAVGMAEDEADEVGERDGELVVGADAGGPVWWRGLLGGWGGRGGGRAGG